MPDTWADVLADLRAQTRILNTLRETQLEQGRTLDEHSRILGDHSRILGEHSRILGDHSQILGEHSRALVTVQAGVDHIIDLLTEQEPPQG